MRGARSAARPITFATTAAAERAATLVSPDGRWLGYATNASGDFHTYLPPVPDGEVKKIVSSLPGGWNVWSPRGREVWYLTQFGEEFLSVEFPHGPDGEPATPRILFDLGDQIGRSLSVGMMFDIAPDGEQIIAIVGAQSDGLRLQFVLNWFEELKQRVPTGGR